MNAKTCIRLVTVLLAVLPAASNLRAEAQDPPPVKRLEIVDKAIAFHGGELYRSSETELEVCSRSGCFHVRARIDGDATEFEVRGKIHGRERRVLWSGESLSRWEGGKAVEVTADSEQGLRDWVMARVYFPFLPFRLNDPSVYKQDLGLETWGEKKLHKVKVTFEPGSSTDASDEYMYWFDPESGRVEQFAYSFEGNPGGLRFRRPRNYRRVGGILFFDQQNLGIEGHSLSVDLMTPDYVETLREVSVVELENVEVRELR